MSRGSVSALVPAILTAWGQPVYPVLRWRRRPRVSSAPGSPATSSVARSRAPIPPGLRAASSGQVSACPRQLRSTARVTSGNAVIARTRKRDDAPSPSAVICSGRPASGACGALLGHASIDSVGGQGPGVYRFDLSAVDTYVVGSGDPPGSSRDAAADGQGSEPDSLAWMASPDMSDADKWRALQVSGAEKQRLRLLGVRGWWHHRCCEVTGSCGTCLTGYRFRLRACRTTSRHRTTTCSTSST